MGRIRTIPIKNVGEMLLEKFPDKFNDDFENNKNVILEVMSIESKKIRNRIAGYITHVIKSREESKYFNVMPRPGRGKRRKRRKK